MKNTVNEAALPGMKALDRMVGTWKISGGASGTATFEWMDGGYFLMQHSAMEFQDRVHKALDIIGYVKGAEAEESEPNITSRSYTDAGHTSDYTYELIDDTLIIWSGSKGSTTFSKSTFSEDGNTLIGAWEWPGGGYQYVMTRVNEEVTIRNFFE